MHHRNICISDGGHFSDIFSVVAPPLFWERYFQENRILCKTKKVQ